MEDSFSMERGQAGSGGMDGGNGNIGTAANTDEASLTHPPTTSSCVTWFLTGHRPAPVHALGLGDPALLDLRGMVLKP